MKTILSHLPKEKQDELNNIVNIIVEMTKPEMVILFGSHARGDWVNDRYVEDGITYTYKSDFDLLTIVEDEHKIKPSIEGKIRRKCRHEGQSNTPINVIFHEISFINQELASGNYFFSDIKKEGIILYDTLKFQLSEPHKLNSEEACKKAQEYFDYWFESANDFFKIFLFIFREGNFNLAAFQLHQACERYLVTTLLVFTGYKPKTHDLMALYHDVCRFGEQFRDVFPRNSIEENRLFNLLQKAYSDARYKMDFMISHEELNQLSERIRLLKELTALYGTRKIEAMKRLITL